MATAAIESRWEVKASRSLRGRPARRTHGPASQALRLPYKANLFHRRYAASYPGTISSFGSPFRGPMYTVPDCARDARKDEPGKSHPFASRRDRHGQPAAARCRDDVAKSERICPDEARMVRPAHAIAPA